MNIYEKLQLIRCELQHKDITKSGKNEFVKYGYFELSDFISEVNDLMLTHKITSTIQYDKEIAKLTLIDCEKPDNTIVFTSPMADGGLKACSPIQNLGATITYLRRYLWINALEIVESDISDASKPDTKKEPAKEPIKETPKVALTVKQSLLKKQGEVFNVMAIVHDTAERVGKNNAPITDYKVSDTDSETKSIISKYGSTMEDLKSGDLVLFKDVKVYTYQGNLTYLANSIEKIGK